MKATIKFFNGLLIALIVASVLSVAFQIPFTPVAISTVVIALVKPVFTAFMPVTGVLYAGLLEDLWTGELLNHWRHEGTFLSRIPSGNQFVNKDAIHLADIGVDPTVLINNTTYPISTAGRTDADIIIKLDKLETENTKITRDELYGLPYDKEGSVLRQHRETLESKAQEKAIHSLCIQADDTDTPVVMTTGASNGMTNARKRFTSNDLTKAQYYADMLGMPAVGRELVLHPLHVMDLLVEDNRFKEIWVNMKTGQVMNLFGFDISKYALNPYFSNASGEKKAFGAAANPADDLAASVFYFRGRAVKATGSVEMFKKEASEDPEMRETKVGFRIWDICLPKKNTGFGAIVSSVV